MKTLDKPKYLIDCEQGLLRTVRFNENGQFALTTGTDRCIKLWRPTKLLHLKTYKGHSADVIDCQSNYDSSQLSSCSNDRSIIVWDVETGKILRRFRHTAPLNNVCYGPHSSTIISSSIDGIVRIYDIRAVNSWEPLQQLIDAKDSVTCCKASDREIITGSLDKCLRTYDVRKGRLVVDTLTQPIGNICISQSNLCLLITCLRGSVVLVDKENPLVLNNFQGNVNKLFRIESVFLLNDSHIASGSEDGKVYIWNSLQTKPLQALVHNNNQSKSQVIQSLSSDNIDSLLTGCGTHLYQWIIDI